MMMKMSVKKVVANNISTYYWGYTAQVNSKVAPSRGNIIQNFVQIYGQIANQQTWFMNFMCNYYFGANGLPN